MNQELLYTTLNITTNFKSHFSFSQNLSWKTIWYGLFCNCIVYNVYLFSTNVVCHCHRYRYHCKYQWGFIPNNIIFIIIIFKQTWYGLLCMGLTSWPPTMRPEAAGFVFEYPHPVSLLLNVIIMILRGRCKKKSKKKLTSVSFAFTHTYTLEKLTLLLFPPSVHGKFWKMNQ